MAVNGGVVPVVLPGSFVMQPQTHELWCWVAVASSVAEYFNLSPNYSQCALANYGLAQDAPILDPEGQFGPANDCCQNATTPYCNRAGRVETALNCFGAAGQTYLVPLPPPAIASELSNSRPVIAQINLGLGMTHFVVIPAILPPSATNPTEVAIADPMNPPCSITYDALTNQNVPGGWQGSQKWTNSFLVTRPAGARIAALEAQSARGKPRGSVAYPFLRDVLAQKNWDDEATGVPLFVLDTMSLMSGTNVRPEVVGTLRLDGERSQAVEYGLDGVARATYAGTLVARLVTSINRVDGQDVSIVRIPALGVTGILSKVLGVEMVMIVAGPARETRGTPMTFSDFLSWAEGKIRHRINIIQQMNEAPKSSPTPTSGPSSEKSP